MQELWPRPAGDVDIESRLSADVRTPPPGRAWCMMVMIASIDGRIEIDGLSGGLGAPADFARFSAARRVADAILVGATTARVEDYRPSATPIVVMSRRLSVDPGARLFSGTGQPVSIYTTDEAVSTHGSAFDGIAELRALGDSFTPAGVLTDLADRGHQTVALEGGPHLNGQFLAADTVDEILLATSPVVASGPISAITTSEVSLRLDRRFSLDRVLIGDGLLFTRWLRERPDEG